MAFTPQPSLLYETDGAICRLTLNRPEVHNALNIELRDALAAAVQEFDSDDGLRVAIVTGAGGRAFSAGADLKEMSRNAAAQPSDTRVAYPIPRLGESQGIDHVRTCSKPVIAAIDGYCVAGGFEVALSCDIRVATRQSTFGLPEPRRSLIAGPGLVGLSRLIPMGEALRLQLSGSTIGAERAHQIGLVQELADDRAQLFAVADGIAADIAECGPLAVRIIKEVVTNARDMTIEQAWKFAEAHHERMARSEDALEGPRAFAEKRKPVWKGR